MVHADDHEVELLVRHLAEKYDGTFDRDEVESAVRRARGELEARSTKADFLHVFIQRRTEQRLREVAREQGFDLDQVQQILFMDDRNTGRSQVAAALANARGGGLLRARSAGVEPGEQVQDRVVDLLRERGYGTAQAEVTPMTGKAALASDVVVTMGLTQEQKDAMPTHGLHQIDWDDVGPIPEEASAQALSGIVDALERRVDDLVHALLHEEGEERRADPEVERELDQVLAELHHRDPRG